MKKNTLKGKVKVLSYLMAFIIMVGVHLAIDKAGAKKEQAEVAQKQETKSSGIDNGIARAYSQLPDTLSTRGEEEKKEIN